MQPHIRWLALPALVATSFSAGAVTYSTADEAMRRFFPQATAFSERTVQLQVAEMHAIASASGLPARSAAWRVWTAMQGDKPVGVMVLDGVIGKFEVIDYAVAIGNDGRVLQIEILTYRESHGYEVRLPGWRKQFVGKGVDDKLQVGEDISNISGATLSSQHVTDGVRRIVAMVATLRRGGRL
jgi:Na+-translocating ferredoxin:NAD+ oxidoreductase RnfG subunit